MYEKRKRLEQLITMTVDLVVVCISLFIAYLIRYRLFFGRDNNFDQDWLIYIFLLAYILVGFAHDWNKKMFVRGLIAELRSIIFQEIFFIGAAFIIIIVLHRADDISRLLYGYFIIVNTILLWLERFLLKSFMNRVYKSGKYSSKMLVVLPGAIAEETISQIIKYNEWNRMIIGVALTDDVHSNAQIVPGHQTVLGFPVVCGGKDLIEFATHNEIDEVFLYDNSLEGTETLTDWVAQLQNMGIIVNVCISSFDIIDSGKKTLNRVGKYATVEYARNIFSWKQKVLKRILDLCGAGVGLIITGIIFPFIAIAIKADSKGPVIFKQPRVGKNGRIFTFYKFRSMSVDAEAQKEKLMEQNEMNGLMFKMQEDPRITKVGKFLRKTSLDEFPQFFNVLKGDMSLVGTRPPTVQEYEQYSPKHKCRLCMTPGITGMWQVSGRSEITDFEEVIKLDMEYIDDWSIWKDIKILFLTVFAVIFKKGAK